MITATEAAAAPCSHCQGLPQEGVAHENVCPRFLCSRCQQWFALLPDPLKKRYGKHPLCYRCNNEPPPPPSPVPSTT